MAEIEDTRMMKNHLQKEELKHIYLFYGPESYLKDLYLERISERLKVDEMNRYFFAGSVDVGEIEALCSEMSMFGDKKLIIISGSGFFKAKKKDDDNQESERASKNTEFIKTIAESDAYVVFVEDEADKRNKIYKEILKYGISFECKRQATSEIKSMLLYRVKNSKRIISDYVLQYMIEGVGNDMNKLLHEMEKLILYVPEGAEITKEIVDSVCSLHYSPYLFSLNNAIAEGKTAEAYKIMRGLLEDREAPVKIIAILSKMWSQFYSVKKLAYEGASGREIAALMGLKEGAVNIIKKQVNNMSLEYIKRKLKQCEELDDAIKSGKIKDAVALELLVIG